MSMPLKENISSKQGFRRDATQLLTSAHIDRLSRLENGRYALETATKTCVNVLVGGDLARTTGYVPVFLTGAVSDRSDKSPPFFSGQKVGPTVSPSFISISDPLVDQNVDLSIGWYTGPVDGRFHDTISALFDRVYALYGIRPLFIGGSAGGFGSLSMARSNISSRALVWNPQTDIFRYSPKFVSDYLKSLYGQESVAFSDEATARKTLVSDNVRYSLLDDNLPAEFIYLQNDTDWHVREHLLPLLQRYEIQRQSPGQFGTESQCIVTAAFGMGHAAPTHEVISSLTKAYLDPKNSAADVIASAIDTNLLSLSDRGTRLRDLRNEARIIIGASGGHVFSRGYRHGFRFNNPIFETWPELSVTIELYNGNQRLGALQRYSNQTWVTTQFIRPTHAIVVLDDSFGNRIHKFKSIL